MIGAYWLSRLVSNRKILARDRKTPDDDRNDVLVFVDKTANSLEDVITPT